MTIILKNNQTLNFGDFNFKCCIGKKGKTFKKKEGDLKTPKGLFELGSLYFRADRENKPLTNIKCIKINKDTICCNEIKNKNNYNKIIKKTKKKLNTKLYFERTTSITLFYPLSITKKIFRVKEAVFLFI